MPIDANMTSNSSVPKFQPLPLGSVCLFNEMSTHTYAAIYILQSIQILSTCTGNVGCDCYIFGIALHVAGQLDWLGEQFQTLNIESTEQECTKTLGALVRRHNQLIQFANDLEDSFNLCIILILAVNTVQICLSGLQMIISLRNGDTATVVKEVTIFYILNLQIFLYSFAGDRLSSGIANLHTAIYCSTWYNLPQRAIKDLVFIMLRTHKTFNLTAGRIYAMNIGSFKNILKATLSYFRYFNANLGQRLLGLIEIPRQPLLEYLNGIMMRIINWIITALIIVLNLGVITEIQIATTYQNFDFWVFIFTSIAVCLSCLFPGDSFLKTRILPIRAVFPFDETLSPMFEIIYAIEFYGVVINIMWVLFHDPTVLGLIRWTNTQLVVLQSNFRHCNNSNTPRATFSMSNKNYNIALKYQYFKTPEELREIQTFIPFAEDEVRVDQDSFIKRFKLCVFHHRRIINIIDEYNKLFSLVFFAQITSDWMLTCIALFQLALVSQGLKDVIQLLQHDDLMRSIYDCGWENNLKTNDKQIILNELSQGFQPMVITAGYFFIFSMETYLSILQKSYSYFAILNTMMSDK
ncbi:uncharacterized protein LOC141532396 [Cotesia typhae]|uniref:uncharacterized protein LOC141532396 n=1 Tax=Cotesia typhae TaxID=2053667 RepID=UPI003D693E99